MDTKPQGPVKLFKYKVSLKLQNGDFQDAIITQAQESKIGAALSTIQQVITPSGPVSQIVIDVGNRKNTA